ncbi:unnamed protein product [Owenia fusiformis]|uniref:Uncharacterized protein n=1 Tax=Owenia fusiformis TaxID=6347 RepID=A0A8J1TGS2_OWEFU|nr:unnamed protein product [Owenia fusiformis]
MENNNLGSLFGAGSTLRSLLENPNLVEFVAPGQNAGNKEKDGKKEGDNPGGYDFSSAFLGPNLWDKTLPMPEGNDFTLEYMDLDEFLTENGLENDIDAAGSADSNEGPQRPFCGSPPRLLIPPSPPADHSSLSQFSPSVLPSTSPQDEAPKSPSSRTSSPVVDVDYVPNEQELALANIPGQEVFDPRKRQFSEEELKPQPMIKKSKKVFVAEDAKDDKYWNRRRKNNVAAKRSRDARRVKENQIAMRASFLEKLNNEVKATLKKTLKENEELKKRLSKYEPV